MNFIKLITIYFLLVFQIKAFEVPYSCLLKNDPNACTVCEKAKIKDDQVTTLEKISTSLNDPIMELELFTNKAKLLKNANVILKDKLASMFRTLRDGSNEPTYQNGRLEIDKIGEDFKKLTILSKEAINIQKKFVVCMNNCSATRKLEINDELKKIQKIKMALLIGQPILANKAFENLILNMDENFTDSDNFFSKIKYENALKEALFDNLQVILKKNEEYSHFEEDGKKPIIKVSSIKEMSDYNANLVSRFPLISEDIVKEFSTDEVNDKLHQSSACYFVDKFKKYTNQKEYQELALDVGLFALPFAFGPIGRLGSVTTELLWGERIAAWGLKGEEVSKGIKLANYSFQGAFLTHEIISIEDKIRVCHEIEASFLLKADPDKLKELDNCKSELSDKLILSELATISLSAALVGPKSIQLLKSLIKKPNSESTIALLLKDFGGGKNKIIKDEIEQMLKAANKEKNNYDSLSNLAINKKQSIKEFKEKFNLKSDLSELNIINPTSLKEYEKTIVKDTAELLYIPGSEIPFLPNSINKVGHIAFRMGDKVYHQTGGSGFKVESFEDFLFKTKKNYKVFGQVLEISEKEKAIMENYFNKMHSKQLPYSFLVNNCSQAICKSMSLADFEKVNSLTSHDPILTNLQMSRSERVVMKTMYNADKDLSVEELKKAALNNRLAFYGVPTMAGAAVGTAGYEAIDFYIEYLNQIKNSK
jgi:hypothetical protein